jgi:hypothetical protein
MEQLEEGLARLNSQIRAPTFIPGHDEQFETGPSGSTYPELGKVEFLPDGTSLEPLNIIQMGSDTIEFSWKLHSCISARILDPYFPSDRIGSQKTCTLTPEEVLLYTRNFEAMDFRNWQTVVTKYKMCLIMTCL